MSDSPDLAALIGSRICHDLISPIGAIGNGVELMMMDGSGKSAEMALISESVAQANARIRYFRIAFGAADLRDQRIARSEIQSILTDQTRGGRLGITWTSPSEMARIEVKLTFLLLLCLETALPFGGRIAVLRDDDGWSLRAEADRLKYDPEIWAHFAGSVALQEVTASRVQFALAPQELRKTGRALDIAVTANRIALVY